MRIFKNQRGDTIMEVLIAIAVLSLILTVSLALANRNTQGNRQAQERGEAAKYTESQIELLKTYLANTTNPDLPANGDFCMKNDGTPTEEITGIVAETQEENFDAFNDPKFDECKKGEFFHTYIHREGNTFTAHTRWFKVAGRGIDEATMVHRMYPEIMAKSGSAGTVDTDCELNEVRDSFGNCVDCPVGMGSVGGSNPSCAVVGSTMRVTVSKIAPDGTQTPSCGKAATQTKSGIRVRLSGNGVDRQGTTDSSSVATFSDLPISTSLSLSVTAPSGYGLCANPQSPLNVITGERGTAVGQGTTTNEPQKTVGSQAFKVYPICNIPVYGQVDRGQWRTYWWQHTGPTWGPNGLPRANPRYQIGPNGPPWRGVGYPAHYYTAENSRHGYGWVNVRYSSLGGSAPEHYNRFEEWYATGYATGGSVTRHVWMPHWVNEVVSYRCPS